jgi:protein gp37
MAEKTGIEWTESTWNPVVGCSIISPGCINCYAMKMAHRLELMGSAIYRGHTTMTKAGPVWNGVVDRSNWGKVIEPLTWKRPRRIFVNSMSDLFHEALPDEIIDTVFAVMALCPQHTFQVLTKRADRMRAYMTERWQPAKALRIDCGAGDIIAISAEIVGETRRTQIEMACEPLMQQFGLADTSRDELWTADGNCKAMQWAWPLPNVWLGVSVENQDAANERIPHLLAVPAAVRFLSCEPLLGPLSLRSIDLPGGYDEILPLGAAWMGRLEPGETEEAKIDWVICGVESGPRARPMHPDWARSLRDQCAAAGVAFFVKQLSSGGAKPIKDMALFPEELRVREFPDGRQHLEFPA